MSTSAVGHEDGEGPVGPVGRPLIAVEVPPLVPHGAVGAVAEGVVDRVDPLGVRVGGVGVRDRLDRDPRAAVGPAQEVVIGPRGTQGSRRRAVGGQVVQALDDLVADLRFESRAPVLRAHPRAFGQDDVHGHGAQHVFRGRAVERERVARGLPLLDRGRRRIVHERLARRQARGRQERIDARQRPVGAPEQRPFESFPGAAPRPSPRAGPGRSGYRAASLRPVRRPMAPRPGTPVPLRAERRASARCRPRAARPARRGSPSRPGE